MATIFTFKWRRACGKFNSSRGQLQRVDDAGISLATCQRCEVCGKRCTRFDTVYHMVLHPKCHIILHDANVLDRAQEIERNEKDKLDGGTVGQD